MKLEKKAYLSRAPQEHEHTKKVLSEAIAKKSEYHAKIYKDVITLEPLNLTIVDVDIDNEAELKADAQPRFESDLEKTDAPGFEF